MRRLLDEYRHLLGCPREMRILLLANMVYAFVLPVVNVFVSAYVMQKTNNVVLVVTFQVAVYLAIPLTFLLNGFLMGRVDIAHLYSFGMLANSMAMTLLMALPKLDVAGVVLVGTGMGAAIGLCWSNRGFLAVAATTNENRNYFYGLEMAVSTAAAVLVPLLAGWMISAARSGAWLSGEVDRAYYLLTIAVFMLTAAAAAVVQRGRFVNPPRARFVFFRFHRLWNQMQLLAALKGLGQGYIAAAPAMLIMHVAHGREGMLGTAQAAGGVAAAVLLYTIGRRSLPEHRVRILAAGLVLFCLGAALNAACFGARGVWLFMLCLLTAAPLLDLGYFPIQLQVIDTVAAIEHRSRFAYLFVHEFGLLAGRLAGLSLFLALARGLSSDFALRYAVLIVGVLQFFSLGVAKGICKGCEKHAEIQTEADYTKPSEKVGA